MSKIADFFVELGLKKDKFDKGMNEAANAAQKKLIPSFSSVGAAIGAAFSAGTIIAFTKAFSYIHNKTTEAIGKLPLLAQENRHNIAYIIDKAGTEGMLPYEAIRIWNENATKYLTDKALMDDMAAFAEIIGLTKLFKKEVLEPNAIVSEDISNIAANEIFDYSIKYNFF